jgi:hypothetical protein
MCVKEAMVIGTSGASAQTPEELETLFEDTLLLRDRNALAALFEEGAVLVVGDDRSARGEAITRLAIATWQGDDSYVAAPRCVMQVRDIALIITMGGVNVARRGSDGFWRYVIVFSQRVVEAKRSQQ